MGAEGHPRRCAPFRAGLSRGVCVTRPAGQRKIPMKNVFLRRSLAQRIAGSVACSWSPWLARFIASSPKDSPKISKWQPWNSTATPISGRWSYCWRISSYINSSLTNTSRARRTGRRRSRALALKSTPPWRACTPSTPASDPIHPRGFSQAQTRSLPRGDPRERVAENSRPPGPACRPRIPTRPMLI